MEVKSNKAYSKIPPIAHIKSLASLLSTTPAELVELSNKTNELWKPGKLLQKKDGKPRPTNDAQRPLKIIHERIKNRILKQVVYPYYILGGISDKKSPRDYKRHAALHANKKILISEDIKDFFPSTTEATILHIWQRFFNFHPDVAMLLTRLTTYKNMLPQGWKASGYLANLSLWDREPNFVNALKCRGLTYSRFMDDITISAPYRLSNKQQTMIIENVYGMLGSRNYRPKRAKHKISSGKMRMEVTGLNVNSCQPSMPKQERAKIRAQVRNCEQEYNKSNNSFHYKKLWNSTSGLVGTMSRFNPGAAAQLRKRLTAIAPSKKLTREQSFLYEN